MRLRALGDQIPKQVGYSRQPGCRLHFGAQIDLSIQKFSFEGDYFDPELP